MRAANLNEALCRLLPDGDIQNVPSQPSSLSDRPHWWRDFSWTAGNICRSQKFIELMPSMTQSVNTRRAVVVDIGRAGAALHTVLAAVNYRNLDEEAAFTGRNTTTEFLAAFVFERIVHAIGRGELGAGAQGIESIRVTLHESHVASASFEGRVSPS